MKLKGLLLAAGYMVLTGGANAAVINQSCTARIFQTVNHTGGLTLQPCSGTLNSVGGSSLAGVFTPTLQQYGNGFQMEFDYRITNTTLNIYSETAPPPLTGDPSTNPSVFWSANYFLDYRFYVDREYDFAFATGGLSSFASGPSSLTGGSTSGGIYTGLLRPGVEYTASFSTESLSAIVYTRSPDSTSTFVSRGNFGNLIAVAVPEPMTLGLLGGGLALIGLARRRRAS